MERFQKLERQKKELLENKSEDTKRLAAIERAQHKAKQAEDFYHRRYRFSHLDRAYAERAFYGGEYGENVTSASDPVAVALYKQYTGKYMKGGPELKAMGLAIQKLFLRKMKKKEYLKWAKELGIKLEGPI